MKNSLALLAIAALIGATHLPAQEGILGTLTSNINIEGLETTFDPETGIATAIGDVNIKYEGVEIKAGRADYNTNSGDIVAKDNVVVVKDGDIFRGENLTYNVKTQELKANHILSGMAPIYYEADNLKTKKGQIEKVEGGKSFFTTHDSQVPNYRVKAKKLTIYPGDRLIMHGAKVYVGNTPVFYLPYFVQPLDNELGYYFRPGYSTQWGAFFLQQYGVLYGDHTLATWMLDLRSKRGVGGGLDLKSLRFRNDPALGELLLYYANDSSPGTGVSNQVRVPANTPSADRYRIAFHHRIYLPGPQESTWYLDFNINKLSDQFFLEDYYLNEFRNNPQPDNTIKVVKRTDRWVATLMTRMQLNDFFYTNTSLPELSLDFTRAPIWKNIYYQGENSLGLYRDKLSANDTAILNEKIQTQRGALKTFGATAPPVIDPLTGKPQVAAEITRLSGTTLSEQTADIFRSAQAQLLASRSEVEQDLADLQAELSENKFFRAHSYHEFLYPMSFGKNKWLTVVPRLGGGFSYYSGVEGGSRDIGSATQPIFQIGTDISGKFSKVYDQVDNKKWGLDKLRHIVEPYLNYSYLKADPIDGLPRIDRLTRSTLARAIDVPLFPAVDSLQTWNVARVGLRNLLQTRRELPKIASQGPNSSTVGTQSYGDPSGSGSATTLNWMGFNSFVDLFMEDPEHDRQISNLYNKFFWNPVPWLIFNCDSQLPLGNSDYNFTEVDTSVTWMPVNSFRWTLGHAYRKNHPLIIDSSQLTSVIYLRLNDTWGFGMTHVYEMESSQLQYQSYTVHRDLTSWTASLGALVRGTGNAQELGFVLSFTLKDFPQVGLPIDLNPNSTGR